MVQNSMDRPNRRPGVRGAFAVALALALPAVSRAGNDWDGGGPSPYNWSNPLNWTGDTLPTYGGLYFGYQGNTGTTNVHDYSLDQNLLQWGGSLAWTTDRANGAVISLFDNGGAQAKIENQSTGLVTLNTAVTFAATSGANYGEINAVNGDLTFGTPSVLTVNGSRVDGIRMFGAGRTTAFNGTVNAAGKYFSTLNNGTSVAIGGTFIADRFFVINNGTLSVSSNSVTINDVVLGGNFGVNVGAIDTNQSGTLRLTKPDGGLTFGSLINSGNGNTSGTLAIQSTNTSGTNTLTGPIFVDSRLRVAQAAGGTLAIPAGQSFALNSNIANPVVFDAAGRINNARAITGPNGAGVIVQGTGTTALSGASTYFGSTSVNGGTLLANNATGSATGSGTVNVNGGATLGGTGTVNGPVNINPGATVTAGGGATPGDTPGTLTNPNTQTWTGTGTGEGTGGIYAWKLGAATADKLEIGLLNIAASVASKFTFRPLNAGGTVAVGTTYTIAHVGGLQLDSNSQTAAASPIDLTSRFYLDLTGIGLTDNDGRFRLAAVSDGLGGNGFNLQLLSTPEPTTAALTLLGATTVLGRRRRR